MIYLLILIYLMLCVYWIDYKKKVKYKKLWYWSLCIVFIVLSGFRYKIGTDTIMYIDSWNDYFTIWDGSIGDVIAKTIYRNPQMERFGLGWMLYATIVKSICSHFNTVLIITASILNFSIFYIIIKLSKYIFTTLLLFYFNFKFLEFEFEILRESLAVAVFLLLCVKNYKNKKWFKYYIGCCLAFLVHYSIIFMFLLPLIRNIRLSAVQYSIYCYFPSLVFGIIGRMMFGTILSLFLGDSGYMGEYVASAFLKEFNLNYILMYAFQPFILYVYIICNWNYLSKSDYTSLLFFTLIFMNFSLIYFTAVRLVSALIVLDCVIIAPIFIHMMKKYRTILVPLLMLCVYNIPTIYSFCKEPLMLARYYPYQWIIYPNQSKEQQDAEYFRLHPQY